MTLLTAHIEAGWREVESGEFGRWAAEKLLNRPGATASTIRVEAESSNKLNNAVSLRESQLIGADEPIKDAITNDGKLVTGDQHEALKTQGLSVAGAEQVVEPVANEDVAAAEAGVDKSEAKDPEAEPQPEEEPAAGENETPVEESQEAPEGEQPPQE